MSTIRVLSENMINLVSAGEVVSRPSSVVKELIENSIDAKASIIEIEIKNGGKKLIRVSDNGCGIPKNDVKTAFLKHATSKIYNETDLEKIMSLGFRGEALSSICAVSKVEILTSYLGEQTGTRYRIDGGKETYFSDYAFSKGTSICIYDLFYNTPARIKFLKKDSSEGNYVSSVVDHLCLSHPEISFKFIKDGKLIFCTPGDGKLSSVISKIFSLDFFKTLIEVDYVLKNISIKGFISDPLLSHSSSKIQNFFVNKRWIKNKIIASAIESALKDEYQNSKVSSIIYIDIPVEAIDVNVHPEKTEIRFENEKIIFECIYNAIKNAILAKRNKLMNELSNAKIVSVNENNQVFSKKSSDEIINKKSLFCDNLGIKKSSIHDQTIHIFENLKKKNTLNDNIVIPKKINFIDDKVNLLKSQNIEKKKELFDNLTIQSVQEKKLKIIGEIFNCFFIIEYGEEILLVDKHAAHERIIFEKLSNLNCEKNSQMLMSTITVDLSKDEYDAIIDNLNLINELGYYLEDFGYGKILVRGIPIYMELSDIKDSIIKISNFLTRNKSQLKINELREFYAQIACKSSIKAGKVSTNEEIKFLIKELINLKLSNCPHGRPIYIVIKKNEIYKKFLRN